VAESRISVFKEVHLDELPVILVVTNAFAVGTDRKDVLERFHFGEGVLQILHECLAFAFGLFAGGDVASNAVDNLARRVGCRIP
jgi:hypothetical protein